MKKPSHQLKWLGVIRRPLSGSISGKGSTQKKLLKFILKSPSITGVKINLAQPVCSAFIIYSKSTLFSVPTGQCKELDYLSFVDTPCRIYS
jgi:hypothetical protein